LELAVYQEVIDLLEAGKDVREHPWTEAKKVIVNSMHCLTAKPIVYLVNVGAKDYTKGGNKWFLAIKEWTIKRSPGSPCIPFSAKFESEFGEMPPEEQKKLVDAKRGSMIPKIIVQGYHALDMIHYFTCGADEVRAWSIRRDITAQKAAGVIHGDFETGFVNCDQYHFDDYVANENSEQAVAKAGKQRTQGKNYIVQDGDILFFRSTKSSGKKR
jgi:obg-like ATPase 1